MSEQLKHIHFRIERTLWRHFRALFPDKGDVQRVCKQALVEYLERVKLQMEDKDSDTCTR